VSRGHRGTGRIWDVKGKDIPTGRARRSLEMGLSRLSEKERRDAKKRRRGTLDLLRRHAATLQDERDRAVLWALVPRIGFAGYPSWDEMLASRSAAAFLALAYRGEMHVESNARLARDAGLSERRTCAQSVDEYLTWRDREDFSPYGNSTSGSVLRRALLVVDRDGVRMADRLVAGLGPADADNIIDLLAVSTRRGYEGPVDPVTRDKNLRCLKAWYNWELQREKERAAHQRREPLFSANPFEQEENRYSRPSKDYRQTVHQKEQGRRFFPEEITRLVESADPQLAHAMILAHRLGLRPGELLHLRWLEDVRPLEASVGYEILIEGGRGRDARCRCPLCQSHQGWAPKNGARRYYLDRDMDQIDWITPVCDALDRWLMLREPARGDFLFPSYKSDALAWTNQDLNKRLGALARSLGIPVGRKERGNRTAHSMRHSCASEMLERGVPHPLAASWIGDTLEEFVRTYGRPRAEDMARVTLARHRDTATHKQPITPEEEAT
jgi:integrase